MSWRRKFATINRITPAQRRKHASPIVFATAAARKRITSCRRVLVPPEQFITSIIRAALASMADQTKVKATSPGSRADRCDHDQRQETGGGDRSAQERACRGQGGCAQAPEVFR